MKSSCEEAISRFLTLPAVQFVHRLLTSQRNTDIMDGYITALGACADGGKARSLCSKIRAGCRDEDSRKRALDAGAADALVGALARFRGEAGVQEAGCYALRAASTGFDADALLRKQAVATAGAPFSSSAGGSTRRRRGRAATP